MNATGVWADQLKPDDARETDVPVIKPSRGTHLTFAHDDLPLRKTARCRARRRGADDVHAAVDGSHAGRHD